MPTIALTHDHSHRNEKEIEISTNPLPQILQTPSGLALLEIQGSVLSEQDVSSAIHLGHLVFPPSETSSSSGGGDGGDREWDGKRVFLFVGKHQRMAGEVRKLGKAIAVVRRKESGEGAAGNWNGEVEIEEIVKYKMLFGSRPEPMGAERRILSGDEGVS